MRTIGESERNNLRGAVGHEAWLVTGFVIFIFVIFSIQLGSVAVPVAGMGAVVIFGALYKRQLFFFLAKNMLIAVYPIVVLFSAAWSDIPLISLSGGVQSIVTLGAGILMGVTATQRQIMGGLFVAMALITLASIISGKTGPAAGGLVLIGVTGSKDQMGYVGLALFTSALGTLCDRGQNFGLRCAALVLGPLGAYVSATVQSTAPMLSTVAFVPAFFGLLFLGYLNLKSRWFFVILTALAVIFLFFILYSLLPERIWEQVLLALNKNTTLTGRTLIWERAYQWIACAPEIGHGFRSFWLGGSSDVIGILHRFVVDDPRTFEMHDTFLEILVDTGWLGLTSFLLATFVFLCYIAANVFVAPDAKSGFLAATYLLFLSRMPIETIVGINGISAVLFYACGTASIVFFMNRASSIAGNRQTASVAREGVA